MAEEELKRVIRLRIFDTYIPVRVPQEEEPLYRKDADLINELLNVYFANFKEKKPDKEIIFYAMIDLGLRLQKELQRNDTQSYDKAMSELTGEIENLLSDKNK
jgi:cell division protein ZapA